MSPHNENNQQPLSFWKSRTGILVQIVGVLLPSVLVLRSGNLLLIGVAVSVLLSWAALRLQKLNWRDAGLKRPSNFGKVFLIAIIATVFLIPLSYELRDIVTALTHQQPNLDAFKAIEGNPKALLIGLVVVWVFGAFGEEMLFRGFLMNSFYKLFPENYLNDRIKWGFSLLLTSILVGFGHSYQGITGMILTSIIGFCFGLIYLMSKRNLWPSILTHGFYDTVAFVFMFSGINLDQLFK
ncbi:MAG: CPBP family intramembrane metalloprotease [Bacteroidetes bacterium]|nr:MAG: CPBP family intramembrane metalloprotease [Bacteroidota bacterium]